MNFADVQNTIAQIRAVIALVTSLKSEIIGLVDLAESLFPAQGAGAQRLEAVKHWLTTGFEAAGGTVEVIERAWPVISSVIAAVVNLRKTGAPAAQ